MDLNNETTINVAALLHENFGATRDYTFTVSNLFLDDGLEADSIEGQIHLTRLSEAILATVDAMTTVELDCQRCLDAYRTSVPVSFSEQFRIAYDVKSGAGLEDLDLDSDSDEEEFEVSAAHELDIAEALRQEIVISLPMRPICGENCPGPPVVSGADEDEIDSRFSVLSQLLDDSESETEA